MIMVTNEDDDSDEHDNDTSNDFGQGYMRSFHETDHSLKTINHCKTFALLLTLYQ